MSEAIKFSLQWKYCYLYFCIGYLSFATFVTGKEEGKEKKRKERKKSIFPLFPLFWTNKQRNCRSDPQKKVEVLCHVPLFTQQQPSKAKERKKVDEEKEIIGEGIISEIEKKSFLL